MICDTCKTDINMHISVEPHDIMHECLECGWYAIVERKASKRTRYEVYKQQLAPIQPIIDIDQAYER